MISVSIKDDFIVVLSPPFGISFKGVTITNVNKKNGDSLTITGSCGLQRETIRVGKRKLLIPRCISKRGRKRITANEQWNTAQVQLQPVRRGRGSGGPRRAGKVALGPAALPLLLQPLHEPHAGRCVAISFPSRLIFNSITRLSLPAASVPLFKYFEVVLGLHRSNFQWQIAYFELEWTSTRIRECIKRDPIGFFFRLQSLRFEHKLYASVKEKMEEMQQHNMSWIEVSALPADVVHLARSVDKDRSQF